MSTTKSWEQLPPVVPATLPIWLAPHVGEVASWGAAPAARCCWVTDCWREAIMYGLCKTHYRRARRAWSPPPSEARYARKSPGVASGCDSVGIAWGDCAQNISND